MPGMATDDALISSIIKAFYDRVRLDPVLGPVFNEAVDDWPDHLDRLEDFWSSMLSSSGRYKGNPVAVHKMHASIMQPAMLARWLELWILTTDQLAPRETAFIMQAKARRIGERLMYAVHGPSLQPLSYASLTAA